MEFDKLFGMNEAGIDRSSTFRVGPAPPFDAYNVGQGIQRPPFDEYKLVRGEEQFPNEVRFCHSMGKKVYDVIGTGYATLVLLSARALQVLRDNRFTGWKSFPVEISGRKRERIEGYEGLVITGRCGPIDWSKGQYVRMPPRIASSKPYDAWIGMYFDPETWDGSDLFMPEETTYPIVVERVKTAFEHAGITNFRFEPLTEFERSWPV